MSGSEREAPAGGPPGRRHPIGAEPTAGGLAVRVWAPAHARVALVTPDGPAVPLAAEGDGHHSATVSGLGAGSLYGFRLSGEDRMRPDPASRFQPDGPDGWSRVVDPAAFRWTDAGWPGVALSGQAIYEMHVGTFTPEGTWAAATAELPRLRDLGVSLVEVMPVAEFAGRWGWGYDGVALFAPFHHYGEPDDLRRFVDRAHALGLGVILDVVYNHLGSEGRHVTAFAPGLLSSRHGTEWGAGPDFDGPGRVGARELVLANAAHWIEEYHLDGLRVDATQDIRDESPDPILAALGRAARAAAGSRTILLIGENEPQHARLLRPDADGGMGFDALWSEDWHHAVLVAITGRREAYYSDHEGRPQEVLSALRRGWLFQGQSYAWQGKRRGTPALDLHPSRFVAYLENHDQAANTGAGRRLHQRVGPGRMRAATALLLLGPPTPMIFQGQERASPRPFTFFADPWTPERREEVLADRAKLLGQFPNLAAPEMAARVPDPMSEATFAACKLRPPETDLEASAEREALALHRDLLRIRREDPVVRLGGREGMEGAVLGPEAFVLRLFGSEGDDRLLLVNLGAQRRLSGPAEPLLAPPEGAAWVLLWSSEHPGYGGEGTGRVEEEGRWNLPAHAALLMGTMA